jgi:hypothetical protein
MRDVMHDIRVVPAIAPVVVVDNTATVSSIIDMQGAQSCTFYVITGALVDADATFAVLLQEGNAANLSDATTVADTDMQTGTPGIAPLTAASFDFSADIVVRRVGYNGNKRYVRATITPTNNTGAAPLSMVCVLGNLASMPS